MRLVETADAVRGFSGFVHVGIDGRHLRASAGRGVGRYSRLLVGALASEFPEDEWTALLPDAWAVPIPGVQARTPRMARRPLFAASALTGRPRLDRLVGGCDVAWVPAPAPVSVSLQVPYVLTVHDLSFEHRASDYPVYERLVLRLARARRLARRAERVIAVSTHVREQVISEWGLAPDRVVAVRSGPGRPPGPAGPLPAGVAAGYVLAVGALEPRKRPRLLAEAHALARSRGLRAGLVLAGDGPDRAEMERMGAKVLGFVEDATLDALYGGALALACVSREEGFGFSPLEALAAGCPPVVSGLPIFEETLGEGALRVPEGDTEALAEALLALEREPGLRERIVQRGSEAVAALSWQRAAHETRAVLAAAAGR